ncbi:MAG: family 78 glycoside hydrolase catalytic domain [Acidobacteriota bacterium]
MKHVLTSLTVLMLWLSLAPHSAAGVRPANLRCEYRVNPLGLDIPRPRLSWVLEVDQAGERAQKQTSYQVLVASAPDQLAAGRGDLWDSGQVFSDQTLHVEYAGKALKSGTWCYWKVHVWDQHGKPSGWSPTAYWSMGLLERSDWGADWIGDNKDLVNAEMEAEASRDTCLGFRTEATHPDTERRVVLDLGRPIEIDAVKLFPAQPRGWHQDAPSVSFPVRFVLEAGSRSDLSDVRTLVNRADRDEEAPSTGEPKHYRFKPQTVRYLQLRILRLTRESDSKSAAALAELEVWSGQRNVAQGIAITAPDSVEVAGWSKRCLVDGQVRASASRSILLPGTMLRKTFEVSSRVVRATLSVTARGLYEVRLNGKRVGEQVLSPEWTNYQKRIQYQTYDVTGLVQEGGNALGALLGAGWYAGRIGLFERRAIYGSRPQLLLRLDMELADGHRESVVSDRSWKLHDDGPIRSADILDGEIYDARKEQPGWDTFHFDDRGWLPVQADSEPGSARLVWQRNEPIAVVKEIKPRRITEPRPGLYVVDMGQNMVGWCRLKVKGARGMVVTLRHGEMLHEDGTLYTANLRSAGQVDQFILAGNGEEVFEPHFTYHGFRYVELSGLSSPPAADAVLGRVFHSSSPTAGSLETSNPLFNQIMNNIVWTQRGNMHSVPTDCPQRDERLGWMGDIQAFAQTAIFNMDMAAFFSKWVQDVRDDQREDGRFPDFAPNPNTVLGRDLFSGVAGWGDAGTIIPWRVYENYGDKRMLQEHFDSARKWVDFIHRNNPGLLWEHARHRDYNDWLNADTLILDGWPKAGGAVPQAIFATAFFAHSVELVSKMAAVLQRDEDARHYREFYEQIRNAFNRAYVKPDGAIEGETQAGYAVALHFNLIPEAKVALVARRMVEGFQRYGGHLSTGIQSTHRLMMELSEHGYQEEAYRLLSLKSFPSWGFMVENGATTIWERWDGYVKGRGFQNPHMNSFNHWALGAVGEWMWRNIIGIHPDESAPAFKHFSIRPRPSLQVSWARGQYNSIRGRIACEWERTEGRFTLRITIPPNTAATIFVPTHDPASVREGARSAADAQGVRYAGRVGDAAQYEVVSGDYVFQSGY